MGEIRHEGVGQSMGSNSRVGRTIAHLQILISEKESEKRRKKGQFEGGGKRAPPC
jgi:hypothetical protein